MLGATAPLLVAEEVGGSLGSAGSTLGPEVPPPLAPLPLPNGGEGRTFLLGWLVFQSEISQQQEKGRKEILFSCKRTPCLYPAYGMWWEW